MEQKQKTLLLTAQVKTEILTKGLKLAETCSELKKAFEELNPDQDANYINLFRDKDTDEVSAYFINYDGDKWHYINDHNPTPTKGHPETDPKKLAFSLVLNACDNIALKKEGKPQNSYIIKLLSNNKPLTLLGAKNKNFVDFLALNFGFFNDGTSRINEIDITEEKKCFASNYLYLNRNCWDADEVRKQATHIFAIYNAQKEQSDKAQAEIIRKRTERQQNKTPTGWERYTAEQLKDFNGRRLIDKLYKNNYNTGYYYYDVADLDASGYLLRYVRQDLKKRTEQLKRQREQERREKLRLEWITSDHTKQLNEINIYLTSLKNMILSRCDLESVLNSATFEELKTLRELYISFKKQLTFENYKDVEEWQNYKSEKVNKYDFYIKAISRGVFNRLACFHHYEKTQTGGYKIKDTEKDPFWRDPNRYIQAF